MHLQELNFQGNWYIWKAHSIWVLVWCRGFGFNPLCVAGSIITVLGDIWGPCLIYHMVEEFVLSQLEQFCLALASGLERPQTAPSYLNWHRQCFIRDRCFLKQQPCLGINCDSWVYIATSPVLHKPFFTLCKTNCTNLSYVCAIFLFGCFYC